MAKRLKCDDVVPGCPTIVDGADLVEILVKAREHIQTVHRVPQPGAGLSRLIREAVRNHPDARASSD